MTEKMSIEQQGQFNQLASIVRSQAGSIETLQDRIGVMAERYTEEFNKSLGLAASNAKLQRDLDNLRQLYEQTVQERDDARLRATEAELKLKDLNDVEVLPRRADLSEESSPKPN